MSDNNFTAAVDGINAEIQRRHNELLDTVKQNAEQRDVLLEGKIEALNTRISELQSAGEEAARKAAALPGGNAKEGGAEFKSFVLSGLETRAAGVTAGTAAAGGYAVPEFTDSEIVQTAVNDSPLLQRVRVLKASSSDTKILVNRRGTSLDWVDETGTAGQRNSTNTPDLAEVAVPFGHLFGKHLISLQAIGDMAFDPEAWVIENVGEEIGFKLGAAILTGSGSAQPKGILSYATAATADSARAFGTIEHVATGTSASLGSSTTVAIGKLYDLIYSMKASHRQKGSFVMNRKTLGAYRGMVDANGLPIWQPSLVLGQPSTLCGFPVIEAEDVPVVGAGALAVVFGNLEAYRVYDLAGMTMLRDPYSYDAYVALKTNKRVGGALADSEAIKVLKCSAS